MTMEDIKQRLATLGYIATATDDWMLGFCLDKVTNHIKQNCNVSEVPLGLRSSAIDMVCGEFLLGKKSSGQDVGIDFEAVAKSIQEGDTTITFDTTNSIESQYEALISYLMREVDFAAYRCIKW